MVMLEATAEDALPPESQTATHIRQNEKHHQLGAVAWQRILEATVGSLPVRDDVGRTANLIINTHGRTAEIEKAYFAIMSSLLVPTYMFTMTAENKLCDEAEFLVDHLRETMQGQLLNNGLNLGNHELEKAGDPTEDEIQTPVLLKLKWD